MAVIKHIAIKNSNYTSAVEYLRSIIKHIAFRCLIFSNGILTIAKLKCFFAW